MGPPARCSRPRTWWRPDTGADAHSRRERQLPGDEEHSQDEPGEHGHPRHNHQQGPARPGLRIRRIKGPPRVPRQSRHASHACILRLRRRQGKADDHDIARYPHPNASSAAGRPPRRVICRRSVGLAFEGLGGARAWAWPFRRHGRSIGIGCAPAVHIAVDDPHLRYRGARQDQAIRFR